MKIKPQNCEQFDKEYEKTGTSALAALDRIRGLITDYPADSSCGAGWDDLGSMSFVREKLMEIVRFMEDMDK